MPDIYLETRIHASQKLVFDLSRSVDLHQKSLSYSKERAVAGKTSGLLSAGERVTWKAKHFGFWFTLEVEISKYQPIEFFEDRMVKGPFKSFIHMHEFEIEGEVVLMKDRIYFQSPAGVLGKIVDALFMKRYLVNLLKRRNDFILHSAESGKHEEFVQTSVSMV